MVMARANVVMLETGDQDSESEEGDENDGVGDVAMTLEWAVKALLRRQTHKSRVIS